MDFTKMQATLEGHLKTLGDAVDARLEAFKTASDEQRAALQTEIGVLKEEQAKMAEKLAEAKSFTLPGVEVQGNTVKRDSFSLARAARALARRNFDDAPYEQEVFSAMREKAMSQGSDAGGGYIVPEEAVTTVIEKLKAEVVAFDLGARDLSASSVPLTIPKLATSATGYWVNENSTITSSDLGFEQINMTPKTVAGRVILSNLLLETSTPTADSIIEADLAQQLGLAMDLGILNGSAGGGVGEPTGIMQTTGVSTTTTAAQVGTPPSVAEMMGFISDLDNANALRGRLGWAIHPLALNEIRQMTVDYSGASVPLVPISPAGGFPTTLFGYPFRTTTQLTSPTATDFAGSIIFGNWDDLLVARWGGLRLLASDTSDDAFSKDQTHIRATMRCDVAVRHPESFSYSVD